MKEEKRIRPNVIRRRFVRPSEGELDLLPIQEGKDTKPDKGKEIAKEASTGNTRQSDHAQRGDFGHEDTGNS